MSYLEQEATRLSGSPVTLILFQYGPNITDVYGYTNNETDVLFDGITYQATPMDVDAVKTRGLSGKAEMTIQLPNDSEASRLFRFAPPPNPVSVFVRRGHRNDPDGEYALIYTGRVLSAKPGSNLVTKFACEWVAVSLRRTGAKRNYQYSCPFALYGSQCRADKLAATIVTQAVAVSGLDVTPTPDWDLASRYPCYVNGSVAWSTDNGTEHRAIVAVTTGGVLTVANKPTGLIAGTPIEISLGCSRLMTDCRDLHNNINNFGGQPWIPTDNPVNTNIYN